MIVESVGAGRELSPLRNVLVNMITSPAGAVAKCCDEYVCLFVCLFVHEDISTTTCAIFTKFFLCMLPISVAYVHSNNSNKT